VLFSNDEVKESRKSQSRRACDLFTVAVVFNHHASSASLPIPKESVPYRIETEDFETEDEEAASFFASQNLERDAPRTARSCAGSHTKIP
jgi:hypothetical protein